MKFFFIAISCWTFAILHGAHEAEYHYELNGSQVKLKFVIEKKELMNFTKDADCDFQKMTDLCTWKYLSEKATLKINDQKIALELDKSYLEGDQLVVLFSGPWRQEEIKELTIQNDCFYEFDHHFKNRIILEIDRFNKSYLLKKKKNKISLK